MAHDDLPGVAQNQRDSNGLMLWCAWTCATMTSPINHPTLKKIDDLLNRLRDWHSEATILLGDADVRERVEHALLDISYVFEYLKAARAEKEEKLKLDGWKSDAESAGNG